MENWFCGLAAGARALWRPAGMWAARRSPLWGGLVPGALLDKMQRQFDAIGAEVEHIRRINEERRYYDNQIDLSCKRIQDVLTELKQE